MAWISVHETVDGPKLRKLYKLLDCSKFEATGILNYLWFWGMQNADKDGLVLYADEEDIERYLYGVGTGCKLDSKKIVQSLLEAGWIDKENGRLYIHDWDIWQKEWYKLQERLKNDAERKRNKRQLERKSEDEKPIQESTAIEFPKPEEHQAEPDQQEEKPVVRKTTTAHTKEFEEFWAEYPKKRDKGAASKAYNARRKDGWSPEELLMACRNYGAECRKKRTEQQYIKNGATFLSSSTPFIDFLPKGIKQEEKKESDSQPDKSNPFGKFMGGI